VVATQPVVEALLADDADFGRALVVVAAASGSLTSVLERDAAAPGMLASSALRTTVDYAHDVAALAHADDPASALRQWKHRQLLRIAARDLLGIANLRVVAEELAELAAACLDFAVHVAAPDIRLAVIGMGKLGGHELNYSSDVDVLFVHDGDPQDAERAARAVMDLMQRRTGDGIVFRTDADLRPEGRAGMLSRSLEGYTTYWDRWAQPWEVQALLKARAVAGDAALGDAFVDAAERFVWAGPLDADAVREVRSMKARAEHEVQRRGDGDRDVKLGPGGIRDVEFAVQLLQLVHGREDPSIRARGTLVALEQLSGGGYVSSTDAAQLDPAYVWLRTVEHRLQLADEQQVHTIPAADDARSRLARVLGFRDHRDASALATFDATHQMHQAVVRSIHEKLYFAPLLDTLAGAGPLSPAAVEERLAAFGFTDVEQTRAALHELTAGLTRRSRVMQQLLPVILGWLSAAPDPDLGLLQLRRLTEGYTRSSTLARRFRETPIAAERTSRVLGSSRVLGLAMHRHPDFVDLLATDASLTVEPARADIVAEAVESLDWREDDDARLAGLRRFKRRHLLRIGARDLLGFADLASVGRELSNLADATVEAALDSLEPSVPFAVIGMGRLGGGELSYASDIDVLFVSETAGASEFEHAERVATRLMRAIGDPTAEGQTFRIDARLRPEGAQGVLTRSIDGYRGYWEQWAQPWEFQALTKARFVAGDTDLARRFVDTAHHYVYRDPFPPEWQREIRRMKARIERERIPPGEDPQFHLKLGRGSLSDVEFTVQLLQLQRGQREPSVRATSTLDALHALVVVGAISAEDAAHLADAYVLCERARNYRYLLTGSPGDALPIDSDAAKLGRMLGYVREPQQSLREDYRRLTRRARDVVERIFYGRE
jgi:glutamate-ammonia-ligase adenylyltransferase